jgi:phenylalanyl-tRNA synthetase beta chain
MRVSHHWLQQYVKFRLSPQALGEQLTMRGLEVEDIERPGEKYDGIVIGHVLEVAKHPNADKLTVCTVDVGTEALQIVCGAPNVAAGQKVAVARVGATVPRNQHDSSDGPFVLSAAVLRGVQSHGMICSEFELDLGPDANGILVLDDRARIGVPLAKYLGLEDVAYEIAVTPNRPDLLSHIGVAREIHALTGHPLAVPKLRVPESQVPVVRHLKIRVEDRENCFRFAARMVRGVRIAPSPAWLQQRLRAVGLRPHNNVVDITNFVMLECGQPLHAFDYDLLHGQTIVVRQGDQGEAFTTLDGKEHTLPDGTVLVCDAERPVSIAGVMGGANSEISDTTADVVIESACWRPTSIRRTSKRLGISTDASQRFERGTDPEAVPYALHRATELIATIAGGKVLKGTIDIVARKVPRGPVRLRPERVNMLLGTGLSKEQIVRLLRRIDVKLLRANRKGLTFAIPSFRVDLEREIDLIEEVARLYGYDKIEDRTRVNIDLAQSVEKGELADRIRQELVGFGFQEALSSSFVDARGAALGNLTPARVLNPTNKEMDALRTTLVPGMLEAVARNQHYGNFNLRLFELGHVFAIDTSPRPKLVENFLEEERVCLLMTGLADPRHWDSKARQVDIFDLKGYVTAFLDKFALDKTRLISYSNSAGLAEDALGIEINGSNAGYLGKVRSDVLKAFGIEGAVYVSEIDTRGLSVFTDRKYKQLPRFPKVRRDLAFVVDAGVSAETMHNAIRENSSDLLQRVELFDVYAGENLPPDKKSLAFSLEIVSYQRTLTDGEIEQELRRIVSGVEKACGASLRVIETER